MADLAPPGRAQRSRLADAERREVVVMHEALELLQAEPIELLLVADGAQGHDAQRLGLASGEERRPVRPGQNANLTGDLADLGGLSTIGSHAVVEDIAAHPLLELCF